MLWGFMLEKMISFSCNVGLYVLFCKFDNWFENVNIIFIFYCWFIFFFWVIMYVMLNKVCFFNSSIIYNNYFKE